MASTGFPLGRRKLVATRPWRGDRNKRFAALLAALALIPPALRAGDAAVLSLNRLRTHFQRWRREFQRWR